MKLCAFPWACVNRSAAAGSVPVNDWIARAARYGLDGLEVPVSWIGPDDSPDSVRDFKARLADNGLSVGMYNLALDNWAASGTLDRAKRQVDFASELGTSLLRMLAQRWHPQIKEISRSRAIRVTVENLAQLADFARPYGISLAIENHHDHVGIEFQDFMHILNGIDVDNVGLNYDPKHPTRIGQDYVAFLRHPKMLSRLKCTHLDNYSDTVEGWNRDISLDEGDLDIPEVIRIIKGSGYDGWLSIEFGGHDIAKVERSAHMVRAVWDSAS